MNGGENVRDDSDPGAAGDLIMARLARPAARVALEALPERWFHHRLTVTCAVPAGWTAAELAADPALPGRVRGAWGRRLMDAASAEALAGRPCPWDPPCAYDALFRERRLLAGLEMPKPFVVSVVAVAPRLIAVTLTLFGFATDWLEGAADALVAGLRGGLALDRGPGPSIRAPFEPLDRAVIGVEGVAAVAAPARARLVFRTPLCLRRDDRPVADGPALISSLGNRVAALARWQDAEVVADWRRLKAHTAGLDFDTSSLRPARWHRASARQGGHPIPMDGLIGEVGLAGDLAPIWPLLFLGATCHAGSHTALGLGRYEVLVGG